MSKFESISDEELGGLVTGEFYDCKEWALSDDGKTAYHCGPDGNGWAEQKIVDINSWADMGPIIESIWDKLITVIEVHYMSLWEIKSLECGLQLRAAAIIYLESLEAQNV